MSGTGLAQSPPKCGAAVVSAMPEKSSNPSAAAVEDAMKHEEGANILYTNSVCLDHFKELPCHTFVDIAACPDPRCLWADSVIWGR